jgi:hypothetical protein
MEILAGRRGPGEAAIAIGEIRGLQAGVDRVRVGHARAAEFLGE